MWIITVFEQNTYRMFEYKTKNEATVALKNFKQTVLNNFKESTLMKRVDSFLHLLKKLCVNKSRYESWYNRKHPLRSSLWRNPQGVAESEQKSTNLLRIHIRPFVLF